MTILPKKKSSKDKNDPENTDHSKTHPHSHSHGHSHNHTHSHSTGSDSRLERAGRSRTSPPRWHGPPSRDDMLSKLDPGGPPFDFDGMEGTAAHNINKRRHRSPPHRTSRKHRNNASTLTHTNRTNETEYDDGLQSHNSEDEYQEPAVPENIDELERWFDMALRDKNGLHIKKMGEDGACLFRAVADQVYGDQEMHAVVRKHCIDYMAKNTDYFMHYVTEDFNTYLNRKRMESCHGNHVEIQALSELYNRAIEVYQYSLEPINTFHGAYQTENEPIRISYHRNCHYNSVVDPYKATIGVGLGLPGLQPGLADKNMMRDATKQSEDLHIEKAMLEDKLKETDWEVTQETIEEQVARESYLQWLRDNEKRAEGHGSSRSASATCSSSSDYSQCNPLENVPSPENRRVPKSRSGPSSKQNSPQRQDMTTDFVFPHLPGHIHSSAAEGNSMEIDHTIVGATGGASSSLGAVGGFQETQSLMNHIPASMFGLTDWEEEDILAQVIAQSEQEYLDNLRKNASSSPPCSVSGTIPESGNMQKNS